MVLRVAVILALGAAAWYLFMQFPARRDADVAERFCGSIKPGASPVEILQLATAAGSATFEAPDADVLVVRFGDGACLLSLERGVYSGKAAVRKGI